MIESIGSYQVTREIGRGGMGVVYLARDTKLDRDVAIKALPVEFAEDADRLARFEREARTLAQLNHPNIAGIYGVEEQDGQKFLILEYVEGETLADRLDRGALPLDEAIEVAIEIASGVEAAHEAGVIHRDLKPDNIKISPEGKVKVLDFGLARTEAVTGSGSSMVMSPTVTTPRSPTEPGAILGTAPYMSPEQARGRRVDKRSDVWSFGVILYEMLTGAGPFVGETVSDSIGAILHKDVELERLPAQTPFMVRHVLARCLERDRKQRLRDIGDARIELERGDQSDQAIAGTSRAGVSRAGWVLAAALTVVAGALAWLALVQPGEAPAPAPLRLEVNLGVDADAGLRTGVWVAISPDGSTLVFSGREDGESRSQLYVRRLDEFEAAPLAGTERARQPAFSPDGRWICFIAGGRLQKIPVTGGAAITLCEAPGPPGAARGVSWGDAGLIAFTPDAFGGIWVVPENGGEARQILSPNTDRGERSVRWPHFLPGSETLLFTSQQRGQGFDQASIVALTLASGERTVLHVGGSDARFTRSGHLVFVREGALFAFAFDPVGLQKRSDPVPVLDGVYTNTLSGKAAFSVSDSGTLVFSPGTGVNFENVLEWVDRSGDRTQFGPEGLFMTIASLSPDGTRIALQIYSDSTEEDLWIYAIDRQTLSRLTFGPEDEVNPIWSPDSRRIAYSAQVGGRQTLFVQPADGSAEPTRITESPTGDYPTSWSPDGRRLAFMREEDQTGKLGLWTIEVSPDGTASEPEPLVTSAFELRYPAISPQGGRMAYQSRETGRFEIYICSYPDGAGRVQVSVDGGTRPFWSHDGTELFFSQGGDLYACTVTETESGELSIGNPEILFEDGWGSGFWYPSFSVSEDGQRFLRLRDVGESPEAPDETPTASLILNWFTELDELTGTSTRR